MQENPYNTYVAYRDNNAWTSERGAAKFIDNLFVTQTLGKGDKGCILNGFKVTQNSPADFTVKITAEDSSAGVKDGHCLIKYDNYSYLCWLTADYTLEIEGSSQNLDRISYIVAYIDRDITYEEEDNIVESPSVMKFVEVKGTESSSPSAPTKSQIQGVVGINNPFIILAELRIPANTSSITTSNITDRRKRGYLSGDVVLDPDNSYTAGFVQAAPNAGVRTRIVITGPNASTPAAIPGVQLIWLRKKS